ncbi:uncharacterized protein VTP21DRAFT_8206 [Calcarisporiella thermophila]|uniref:uncharacterized protein n=1 Tax=Calcarisporiella thermophila TaxID=911321 RepID=UPI003742FD69
MELAESCFEPSETSHPFKPRSCFCLVKRSALELFCPLKWEDSNSAPIAERIGYSFKPPAHVTLCDHGHTIDAGEPQRWAIKVGDYSFRARMVHLNMKVMKSQLISALLMLCLFSLYAEGANTWFFTACTKANLAGGCTEVKGHGSGCNPVPGRAYANLQSFYANFPRKGCTFKLWGGDSCEPALLGKATETWMVKQTSSLGKWGRSFSMEGQGC